jgi:hypothetical protein
VNLTTLVARGEAMHEALGREYYLTGAGLKSEPAFQTIYEQFSELTSDDALAAARASASPPLLEWVMDVRVGRLVAPLEEQQLVWEQAASVAVDGKAIPYLRVPIELGNTPDRDRREALDAARGRAGADGLNAIRRERFQREHYEIDRLSLGDYVTASSALSGIDLDALGREAGVFLDRTADMYREVLARVVRGRLDIGLEDLVRSDAAWLFRADRFDAAFPADCLMDTARRQMTELGIDLMQNGRVHFDTEERSGKQPRAFCVSVRVPDEVYLVLRPRGGHQDYRTFYHELGHALHFASVDPDLPFTARHLGDNSVTEGFAMLWDHFTLDTEWLTRYAELPRREAQALAFELWVHEVFMVRRYAAKLLYELELHRSDLTSLAPRYAELLTGATAFRYLEDDFLLDVDSAFYAARYLRAWQLEATLTQSFTRRFGSDWYRNPDAGGVVHELMAHGQAEPADRLALQATGDALRFDAVADRLEHAFD